MRAASRALCFAAILAAAPIAFAGSQDETVLLDWWIVLDGLGQGGLTEWVGQHAGATIDVVCPPTGVYGVQVRDDTGGLLAWTICGPTGDFASGPFDTVRDRIFLWASGPPLMPASLRVTVRAPMAEIT